MPEERVQKRVCVRVYGWCILCHPNCGVEFREIPIQVSGSTGRGTRSRRRRRRSS